MVAFMERNPLTCEGTSHSEKQASCLRLPSCTVPERKEHGASGTIGSRIRNLRNRDGMSQEQLALLLHFENKGTISSYETDRRTVPSDVVIRLAEIFQTTTDYLLCGKYPERNIREVDPEMQEMMEVMLSLRSDAARKTALLHRSEHLLIWSGTCCRNSEKTIFDLWYRLVSACQAGVSEGRWRWSCHTDNLLRECCQFG